MKSAVRTVRDLIAKHPDATWAIKDLERRLPKIRRQLIANTLGYMVRCGEITRVGWGRYKLIPQAEHFASERENRLLAIVRNAVKLSEALLIPGQLAYHTLLEDDLHALIKEGRKELGKSPEKSLPDSP